MKGNRSVRTVRRGAQVLGASLICLSLLPSVAHAVEPSPEPPAIASLLEPEVGARGVLVEVSSPHWEGDTLVLTATANAPLGVSEVEATAWDGQRSLPVDASIVPEPSADAEAVALVFDNSGSMTAPTMRAAISAAQDFVRTLPSKRKVALISMGDRVKLVQAPTAEHSKVLKALSGLRPRGETALYDGVLAAAALDDVASIVVLSDGADTISKGSLQQVEATVTTKDLHIDVVALPTAEGAMKPLQALASAGTGEVVQAQGVAELTSAMRRSATDGRYQFRVALPGARAMVEPGREVTVGALIGTRGFSFTMTAPAAPTLAGSPTPSQPTQAVAVNSPSEVAALPVRASTTLAAHASRLPWLGGGVFLALLLALAALLWPESEKNLVQRRRVQALSAYTQNQRRAATPAGQGGRRRLDQVVSRLSRVPLTRRHLEDLQSQLDCAGTSMTPHEWIALRLGASVLGAAVGAVLIDPAVLGGVVGAAACLGLAVGWLRHRQSARRAAFAEQLPDTLQMLASSLKSGFPLQQSLASAQEHGAAPMSSELRRALSAARVGADLDDELELIATRMQSEDWRLAVMAIKIQRSVGGSLAEVLATTSKTMRDRAAVARHARALSAEGRLSAYVLLGLPIVVGAFLLIFRGDYLRPLWTTFPGAVMLVLGVMGMLVGSRWLFSITKVTA